MSLNNKSDSEKKQEIQSKIEAVSRKLTAEDRDQLMQVLEYDDFRARVASLSMEDIQTHSSFELLADLLMSDQELTDELYTALTDPLNRHGVHGRCCAYAPYREILSHAKKIPEIPSPDENIEKSTIELKLTIYRVHYILEYVASPAQKANLLAQELQHIDNALLCVMEDLHSIDPFGDLRIDEFKEQLTLLSCYVDLIDLDTYTRTQMEIYYHHESLMQELEDMLK